jgi:hypothetical protein
MTEMNENPSTCLDDALAACLDDLQGGRDTVDGCLARYPGLAGELAPALRAAAAVRALPPVVPSPAFRAVAGARMQKLIQAREAVAAAPSRPGLAPAPRHQPLWRSLAWRLAAILVVLSLMGGGVALASADSLPDQPLYGVKLATERLQVALAPAAEIRFEVLLQQADRRLAEATVMVLAGKYERAFGAMAAYDVILRDMTRAVNQASARGKDIAPLVVNFQQHVTRQQSALQLVYAKAPPRARPAVQRIINAAIEAQNGVLDAIVTPRPAPRPTMTPV